MSLAVAEGPKLVLGNFIHPTWSSSQTFSGSTSKLNCHWKKLGRVEGPLGNGQPHSYQHTLSRTRVKILNTVYSWKNPKKCVAVMLSEPGWYLFEALHHSCLDGRHDILGPEGRKGTAPFDHLLNDLNFFLPPGIYGFKREGHCINYLGLL